MPNARGRSAYDVTRSEGDADNGKCGPYTLKSRRTLVKSWLCLLLLCELDKVASKKGSVLHSNVPMKGLGRRKKPLQQNIVDLFPDIPTVPDR